MAKQIRGLSALALFLASSASFALGLGDIEIRSRLNQPLSARITLSTAGPSELNTATVRLASNEEFARAGVERSDFLSSLEFEIKGDQIQVSSRGPAREPFVSFIVEVRWSGGRLLREYTVLLDPPDPNAKETPAPQSARDDSLVAPGFNDAPASSPTVKPATSEGSSSSRSGSYGPIQAGETLWSVAQKLKPSSSVTMDQMMLALYEANPQAFDGTIQGLRRGSTLRVPDADEARATDPATATERVRGARTAAPRKPAPVEPVPTPPPAPKPEPVPEPAKPAPPVEAVKPVEPVASPAPVAATPAPVAPVPATPAAPVTPAPTPATPPPASKSMYDEEPAPAPTPAPAAASPAAVAPAASPVDPTPSAAAPAPSPTPAAPPAPPAAEEFSPSILDNPLFMPAVGGIVLLGAGVIGFIYWKRRRGAVVKSAPVTPTSSAPAFDPAAVAATIVAKPAPAAAPAKSARQKLEEEDSTLVVEPPMSSTAALESTLASTNAAEVSRTLSQTVAQEPEAARTAGGTPRKLDFDVTASFAAETVQINLDANDPLAEADFHLAYGLYDEAALLLKQAADKNPGRVELKTKLAEVYFAASKPDDFRKLAESLKSQLPPAQWSKMAIMGQQLCPDAAIFKDAGAAITADIDLAFDEPAAPAAAPALSAPSAPDTLDFKIEDLQLPEAAASAPAAAAADDNTVQFDLGELKLDAPEPAAAPAQAEVSLQEMSLDQFDAPAAEAAPAAETSLDAAGGDEVATKLDLARAYMDMGDADMAKSLLGEVSAQGNAQQKGEAQALLSKIGK